MAEGTRNTRMVYPNPGFHPFRELMARIDDGDIGDRTFSAVAAAALYFALFRGTGGKVPHTKLARMLHMHHADVKAILDAWAGVIYNALVKGVDFEGNPQSNYGTLAPVSRPLGQQRRFGYESGVGCVPLDDGDSWPPRMDTSRPGGNPPRATETEAPPTIALRHDSGPAVSSPLSTPYRNEMGTREGRLLEIFKGDRLHMFIDIPSRCSATKRVAPEKVAKLWADGLKSHLAGKARLGFFPISMHPQSTNKVKVGVVDLDGEGRLNDALAVVEACTSYGLVAYLERSHTDGFHVWLFFSRWLHAGYVHRFLNRMLDQIKVAAEVRPSCPEVLAGDGPGQLSICLPYFGDGGPQGDQCRIIDPDTLRPIPLEAFLDHVEFNEEVPTLPAPAKRCRSTTSAVRVETPSTEEVAKIANGWPAVGEGEVHQAPNGKMKFGRTQAAIGHAGELAAMGVTGNRALTALTLWNTRNLPPLHDRALDQMVKYAERKERSGCNTQRRSSGGNKPENPQGCSDSDAIGVKDKEV